MKDWIEKAKVAIGASSKESSVYIGTDSQVISKRKKARYSTVIILHKDSKHGCQIFYDSVVLPDYGNLRQRLMTEVGYAIGAASEILDSLDGRHLEVHIDVNPDPKHKSNIAVKEAIGYVRGSLGIDPKIKPHSWAAAHCADHVVRHK